MAKKKQTPIATAAPVEPVVSISPPSRIARLSSTLRFPYLVILSFGLSFTLYSSVSRVTAGDLSTVSRSLDNWWEIAGLIGWKTVELAVGWWGNYDRVDLACLTVLSHMPHLYLLTNFYGIRPTTMLSCLTIDVLSVYIPFALLRDISASHRISAPKGAVQNPNLVNDFQLRLIASMLGASVYGAVVFSGLRSWIPVYFTIYFEGIRDLSTAHSAVFLWLAASFMPIGYAAEEFVFRPAFGSKPNAYDKKIASFNPETASLADTLEYNIWGYSARTRTLIQRTMTLVAVSGFHTWIQTYVAIEGVQGYGAAGWSGLWATAAMVTGVTFWWIGNIEREPN